MMVYLNRAVTHAQKCVATIILVFGIPLLVVAQEAPPAESRPASYRIVLLHSFPSIILSGGEELTPSLVMALREKSKVPLDISAEYTGLDRYSGPAYEDSLLRLYNEKYGSQKVDLIIAIGKAALEFLVSHRFLEKVPVVTTYSGDANLLESIRLRRPNLAGIYPGETTTKTVDLMLSLYPKTRRINVVFGSSPYDRSDANKGKVLFQPWEQRIQFSYWNDLTLDQMELKAKNLPPEDLILFARVTRDASGRDFNSNEPVRRIAAASNRPVFGMHSAHLGEGITGGVLVSPELSARAAADLIVKVLSGTVVADIPLERDPGFAPIFDWRQLQRWDIREKDLPPGSLVRFRKVSLWESYWKEISIGLGIILIEGVLIAGLVFLLRQRRKTVLDLAIAEVRYRTVADFTYDWEIWRLPNGSFEYLSPACERLSGYSPIDFKADPFLFERLVVEEDLPAWRVYQENALAGQSLGTFEYRIRTKDGELRWVEQTSNPVRKEPDEISGYRGSIQDISTRKHAELEIKALKDRLEAENTYFREQIQVGEGKSEILGLSGPAKNLRIRIQQVAPLQTTVLIQGETGTGKELVAESVHGQSRIKERPLIKVNCAAFPPGLAESELFGHEKGAFTGAHVQRKGRFELADGGTLFLDEVGELSPEIQAKLLRVLQDGEFQRVGGDRTIKVDVRVIAATNRDLAKEVTLGRFREDLWYRLNVFPIPMPALRDRKEDIPSLAHHFLVGFCNKAGRPLLELPNSVIQRLQDYDWPGNVRELQNVIERAVIISDGPALRLAGSLKPSHHSPLDEPGPGGVSKTLAEIERDAIVSALKRTNGRVAGKQGAAEILGLNPSTLRMRIQKLGLKGAGDL